MKNPIAPTYSASKLVFSRSRVYWLLFLIFFVLAIVLFVLVPVWSVPGNTVGFQLSLFTSRDWFLFVVLAILIGLLIAMQVFIFRRARESVVKTKSLSSAASGMAGAYAGILGGVFATAACSWCIAALFGFLGTGTVLFIAHNQFWAVLIAIGIMIVSLYFASKKVINACGC